MEYNIRVKMYKLITCNNMDESQKSKVWKKQIITGYIEYKILFYLLNVQNQLLPNSTYFRHTYICNKNLNQSCEIISTKNSVTSEDAEIVYRGTFWNFQDISEACC